VAASPDAAFVARTEFVDFDGSSALDGLDESPDVLTEFESAERCIPDIPLLNVTASAFAEADALLADVRPELETGLVVWEEELCR
jgi:hypothetical protein